MLRRVRFLLPTWSMLVCILCSASPYQESVSQHVRKALIPGWLHALQLCKKFFTDLRFTQHVDDKDQLNTL